jgi:hypothetical protein
MESAGKRSRDAIVSPFERGRDGDSDASMGLDTLFSTPVVATPPRGIGKMNRNRKRHRDTAGLSPEPMDTPTPLRPQKRGLITEFCDNYIPFPSSSAESQCQSSNTKTRSMTCEDSDAPLPTPAWDFAKVPTSFLFFHPHFE